MSDKARRRTHCQATALKPLADNDVTGQCLYGPMKLYNEDHILDKRYK